MRRAQSNRDPESIRLFRSGPPQAEPGQLHSLPIWLGKMKVSPPEQVRSPVAGVHAGGEDVAEEP
jgi:hypothetical protein